MAGYSVDVGNQKWRIEAADGRRLSRAAKDDALEQLKDLPATPTVGKSMLVYLSKEFMCSVFRPAVVATRLR